MSLPNSNVLLVTFPKILDNPDVLETFLEFWYDTIYKKMKEKDKYDIDQFIELSETYVSKIYPVLYNTTFDLSEENTFQAAE